MEYLCAETQLPNIQRYEWIVSAITYSARRLHWISKQTCKCYQSCVLDA